MQTGNLWLSDPSSLPKKPSCEKHYTEWMRLTTFYGASMVYNVMTVSFDIDIVPAIAILPEQHALFLIHFWCAHNSITHFNILESGMHKMFLTSCISFLLLSSDKPKWILYKHIKTQVLTKKAFFVTYKHLAQHKHGVHYAQMCNKIVLTTRKKYYRFIFIKLLLAFYVGFNTVSLSHKCSLLMDNAFKYFCEWFFC